MGYKRSLKVFDMTFEEFPGLEVRARSVPVGKLMEVLRLTDSIRGGDTGEEAVSELFGWFSGRIVSWNYQDEEGHDLPPTLETFLEDDFDFVMKLVMGWVNALTSALVPTTPGAGATSSREMESSIPMTTANGPDGT